MFTKKNKTGAFITPFTDPIKTHTLLGSLHKNETFYNKLTKNITQRIYNYYYLSHQLLVLVQYQFQPLRSLIKFDYLIICKTKFCKYNKSINYYTNIQFQKM